MIIPRTIKILALSMLALSGCAVVPDAPNVEGTPLPSGNEVALGQPIRLGEVVVTPKTIVEDSRCPVNVQCVWAGRLIVSTRIDGSGWRDTAPITLGESFGTHGHVIAFVSVRPEKTADKELQSADYSFRYEAR